MSYGDSAVPNFTIIWKSEALNSDIDFDGDT